MSGQAIWKAHLIRQQEIHGVTVVTEKTADLAYIQQEKRMPSWLRPVDNG